MVGRFLGDSGMTGGLGGSITDRCAGIGARCSRVGLGASVLGYREEWKKDANPGLMRMMAYNLTPELACVDLDPRRMSRSRQGAPTKPHSRCDEEAQRRWGRERPAQRGQHKRALGLVQHPGSSGSLAAIGFVLPRPSGLTQDGP